MVALVLRPLSMKTTLLPTSFVFFPPARVGKRAILGKNGSESLGDRLGPRRKVDVQKALSIRVHVLAALKSLHPAIMGFSTRHSSLGFADQYVIMHARLYHKTY